MDIKNATTLLTPDSLRLTRSQVQRPADDGSPSATRTTGASVDTLSTRTLVGAGLDEAMAIHEAELDALTAQIRSGDYHADLDVVASRVLDVLGL